ncbi:MAG: HAMP domain-containing protein, partial [Sphingobacteriales bacterium]
METLMGTLGTYDVYKSYQRELELKASAASSLSFDSIRNRNAFMLVDTYLEKLFGTFVFDSTYTSTEWKGLAKRSQNELRTLQMSLLDKVEGDVSDYYESEKRSKTRTLVYLVIAALLLAFIVSYILAAINKNLKQIQRAALRLASGETDIALKPQSNDAIGSLARSIRKVDEKNKELAMAAEQIGKGNFSVEVQPRSTADMLGNAIVQMKQNLLLSTSDLERSREEFRIIADFVPQVVWTARPDGYIDYYNKQWYEITGAKKQFGDLGWIPVLHPDDVGRCLATWHRSVETGKPYEIEYRFWDHRSQSYRWFLGRALPVRDETGAILKWFGTGTDIHDQKMQKEKLEELV